MKFLIAAAVLVPCVALAMPHGRPGLWNIAVKMERPPLPPDVLKMMKERNIKVPGMNGEAVVNQMCMTMQDVTQGAAALARSHQNGVNCTTRLLTETSSLIESDIACHGPMMDGMGHSRMTWRGDTHYDGEYSFKGMAHGQPNTVHTFVTGDFVKADCGAVKPLGDRSH